MININHTIADQTSDIEGVEVREVLSESVSLTIQATTLEGLAKVSTQLNEWVDTLYGWETSLSGNTLTLKTPHGWKMPHFVVEKLGLNKVIIHFPKWASHRLHSKCKSGMDWETEVSHLAEDYETWTCNPQMYWEAWGEVESPQVYLDKVSEGLKKLSGNYSVHYC